MFRNQLPFASSIVASPIARPSNGRPASAGCAQFNKLARIRAARRDLQRVSAKYPVARLDIQVLRFDGYADLPVHGTSGLIWRCTPNCIGSGVLAGSFHTPCRRFPSSRPRRSRPRSRAKAVAEPLPLFLKSRAAFSSHPARSASFTERTHFQSLICTNKPGWRSRNEPIFRPWRPGCTFTTNPI